MARRVDRADGNLYVADVGQNASRKSTSSATRAGVNYGWNITEGSSCYNAGSCNRNGLELPVLEYGHGNNQCSVTGGFVYRGAAIPQLAGTYFYADYCAGWVKSFTYNGAAADQRDWNFGSIGNVTSFGEDSTGEIYITSSNGRAYKNRSRALIYCFAGTVRPFIVVLPFRGEIAGDQEVVCRSVYCCGAGSHCPMSRGPEA